MLNERSQIKEDMLCYSIWIKFSKMQTSLWRKREDKGLPEDREDGVGCRGRDHRGARETSGWKDSHGVCMKVNSPQIVHFTCVWFMGCHLHPVWLSSRLDVRSCFCSQRREHCSSITADPKWAHTGGFIIWQQLAFLFFILFALMVNWALQAY